MLSWVRGFLIALAFTAIAGAVASSTFVLNALAAISGPIPIGDRLQAAGADIVGFGPTYAAVLAVPLALLWGLAGVLTRKAAALRLPLMALAGGAAVGLVLVGLVAAFGNQVVAGAREPAGLAAQVGVGAIAGALFALVHRPRPAKAPTAA